MNLLNRGDLKTRLFLIVFGTTVAIGLLTVLLMFYVLREHSLQDDAHQAQQLLDAVEDSAAIASFTNNREIAENVIHGLVRSKHVCQARLYNMLGVDVSSAKYASTDNCSPVPKRVLYSPFDSKEIVGYVEMRLDSAVIQAEAYRSAGEFALSLLALVLLPGVVIWLEVSRLITRPIHRLSVQLHHILPGTSARIEEVTKQKHDEIVQLVDDINQLLGVAEGTLEEEREQRVQIEKMEQKYQHLAHHDLLTGLPNRSLFNDRLQQMLVHAKRDAQRCALIFLDLNKFKPINDSLGHNIGDMVLKQVAQRLLAAVRESDTVARIGGDEFVVLLPVIEHISDILAVANKIQHALESTMLIHTHTLHIGASIGIAVYPEHGEDEITLIKNADAAMYRAKQNPRECVQIYTY